jgi:hypothetical protein
MTRLHSSHIGGLTAASQSFRLLVFAPTARIDAAPTRF